MLAEHESAATGAPKPNAGLSINLHSNNPFLNPQTGSPALPPQPSPNAVPRQSTNPFLAAFEQDMNTKPAAGATAVEQPSHSNAPPAIADDAKELFKRLTIAEANGEDQKIPRKNVPTSRRGPPTDRDRSASRPSRREEPQFRRGPNGLMIPVKPKDRQDPSRRSGSKERRRRPSSEIHDRSSMTKEEMEAREKRRREREARYRERDASRDSKISEAPRHSSSRRRRNNQHVDVVDKLDVTGGLYGVTGLWHHDGPFDACRPGRNRKKDSLAPMGAFPSNSANQTMGGSGPINDGSVLQNFHGVDAEGFQDFSAAYQPAKPFVAAAAIVNPTNRVEPVHGEETMGLGTSTFLEGAPASRQAIQRTQSENNTTFGGEGISRKKSIAMRIRGMSQSKGRYHEQPPPLVRAGTDRGPFQDRSTGVTLSEQPFKSPPVINESRQTETNPFDKSRHDDAYEKKGASIKVAEAELEKKDTIGEPSSPATPKRVGIERRATDNSMSSPEQKSTGGGFLNRVKSLKGPRKMRSERNPS